MPVKKMGRERVGFSPLKIPGPSIHEISRENKRTDSISESLQFFRALEVVSAAYAYIVSNGTTIGDCIDVPCRPAVWIE